MFLSKFNIAEISHAESEKEKAKKLAKEEEEKAKKEKEKEEQNEKAKKQFQKDKKRYKLRKQPVFDYGDRYFRVINGLDSNEYYDIVEEKDLYAYNGVHFTDKDIKKAKSVKILPLDDKVKEIKEEHSFDKDAQYYIVDMYVKRSNGEICAVKEIIIDHREYFKTHQNSHIYKKTLYRFDLSTGKPLDSMPK